MRHEGGGGCHERRLTRPEPEPERGKPGRSTKPCWDRRDFPWGRDQHLSLRCGRRERWCSTVALASSSCRLSMSLCCRWWNSQRNSSDSFAIPCLWLPSRLSPRLALPDGFFLRTFPLDPQMAEQLVEVPTVLSSALLRREESPQSRSARSWCWRRSSWISPRSSRAAYCGADRRGSLPRQHTVEQTVDIPFPFGHGFRRGQVSTASLLPEPVVEYIVPAPSPVVQYIAPAPAVFLVRGEGPGRLQDFHPRQGHTQRSAAQNVDIPVPGELPDCGRLCGSPPGESSRARRGAHVRGRADHRRFVGRLFILPDSRGCGFIESSAEAESGKSTLGGFRVPVSWQGHFVVDSTVTFSVRKGPNGYTEACDIVEVGSE